MNIITWTSDGSTQLKLVGLSWLVADRQPGPAPHDGLGRAESLRRPARTIHLSMLTTSTARSGSTNPTPQRLLPHG